MVNEKNPHNYLSRQGEPPLDKWKCEYCGIEGTFDEVEAIECSYKYPPCEYCGQTPICASDCKGVALALSEELTDTKTYLAGFGEEN